MNSDYLNVEPVLKELIAAKDLELRELSEANLPLFLLAELGPDLVAFAGISGEPEKDYGRALDIFKSLYADAGDAWADRDLTLVVCTHERDRKLSAYWNQIELDKYFCRKFVIDVSKDLSGQLKRLPFVPLNPQRVAGLTRPLSAQTLLRKKHGLETWLADGLAVPGGRSPESIVTKSLAAPTVPTFQNLEIESFVGSPIAPQAGVRIKDIRIENFRAYCVQQFDFQADVIVLYGPNGLGKTSLFDAMDFLCTGGVWRFDDRYAKNEQQRLAALTRLGADANQARVSATLSVNGKEFKVERHVSDAKSATVNGSSSNRTKTLIRLANLPKSTKIDLRVENFVRLFRATHLFGQDTASLTCDIHNKSTLSEDTVARMLAFQDYVEAISKSQKVSGEIAGKIEVEDSRRRATAEALKAKQVESDSLSTIALSLETPEMVTSRGDDLAKEVSALTHKFELESHVEITSSVVQGWRGLLEGQLSHLREQLTIAKDAEGRFPRLQELKALVKDLAEKRESARREQAHAQDLLQNRQKALSELETKRNALVNQQRGLTAQVDATNWLNMNVSEYQRLRQETKSADKELQVARAGLARLAADCEKISAEAALLENSTRQIQQQIHVDEKELSSVNDFLATITEWRMELKRSDELSEKITRATNASREIENEISSVSAQLQQASGLAAGALNVLNSAQQSQTELQTLLDNLTQYVSSEVCPLCGHPHKSKAALLDEIDRQRGAHNERVNNALREVESTKSQEQVLEARLEKLRQNQILGMADLNSLIEERDRISARLEQYSDRALALGIVDTNPDKCQETANARAGVLASTLTKNRQQLDTESELLANKKTALVAETEQRNQAAQLVIELEGRYRAAGSLISQLQKKAADLNVDFELVERAREQFDRLNKELKDTQLGLDAIDPSQRIETEVNTLRSDIGEREKRIRDLDTRLSVTRQSITEIEQVFARLDFSLDVKVEEVGSFRMRLEEEELALENLRGRVIDFEIALDAAQTQAALVKMQDELAVLRKTEAESKVRIDALNKWRAYFDEIHDSLSNVQQTVLNDYVDKYGPLASKIQQRLRPVYGFGELKLHVEEGGIEVTVERNGTQYLPSDYFSESQLQIVMLSLFLSAVLTQTWSSFGLILLDDPVTHFDDLNAYALLDVIRGLVDTGGVRHQFVVSTCEERLYRLMRQRFSRIKTDVAFYEFQSIGDNGPVIIRR